MNADRLKYKGIDIIFRSFYGVYNEPGDRLHGICLFVKATDIVNGVGAFVPTPLMKRHCC